MASIKAGFADKELNIIVDGMDSIGRITIKQAGLKDLPESSKWQAEETMAFVTINELIMLRDEINKAIRDIAGV